MGRAKLLLPWGDQTVIDQVLQAWTASRVDHVVVVCRRDDGALAEACRRWPVVVVQPEPDPPDMKASIQLGLRRLQASLAPTQRDYCFVAPADLPTLSAPLVDALIAAAEARADQPPETIVPRFGDRPGHPALLPWPVTDEIFNLPENAGVDQIVNGRQRIEVPLPPQQWVTDINTPQQYQQLLGRLGTR